MVERVISNRWTVRSFVNISRNPRREVTCWMWILETSRAIGSSECAGHTSKLQWGGAWLKWWAQQLSRTTDIKSLYQDQFPKHLRIKPFNLFPKGWSHDLCLFLVLSIQGGGHLVLLTPAHPGVQNYSFCSFLILRPWRSLSVFFAIVVWAQQDNSVMGHLALDQCTLVTCLPLCCLYRCHKQPHSVPCTCPFPDVLCLHLAKESQGDANQRP